MKYMMNGLGYIDMKNKKVIRVIVIISFFLILQIFFVKIIFRFDGYDGVPILTFNDKTKIVLDSPIINTPIIVNDSIFVQTIDSIFAIDLEHQKRLWDVNFAGNKSNCPMAYYGNILVASNTTGIVALDISGGEFNWKFDFPNTENLIIEDIVVNQDTVFVTIYNDSIYAINLNTGEPIWKDSIENRSSIDLFLTKDNLIVRSISQIIAYEKNTGNKIWEKEITTNYVNYFPNDNEIFAIDIPNSLFILDADNGNTSLTKYIELDNINCITLYQQGAIVSNGGISYYDFARGKPIWTNSAIDDLSCAIVTDEKIYVRKDFQDLYEFDMNSGELIGRYPLKNQSKFYTLYSIEPILYQNWLIVPTDKKMLELIKINGN